MAVLILQKIFFTCTLNRHHFIAFISFSSSHGLPLRISTEDASLRRREMHPTPVCNRLSLPRSGRAASTHPVLSYLRTWNSSYGGFLNRRLPLLRVLRCAIAEANIVGYVGIPLGFSNRVQMSGAPPTFANSSLDIRGVGSLSIFR